MTLNQSTRQRNYDAVEQTSQLNKFEQTAQLHYLLSVFYTIDSMIDCWIHFLQIEFKLYDPCKIPHYWIQQERIYNKTEA